MNELDRLIFDDLIMCFFDKWINTPMRDYYLNIFRDAFPENEHYANLIEADYIKEIN